MLHPDLINANMKAAQYAVRGELYLKGEELRKAGRDILYTNGEFEEAEKREEREGERERRRKKDIFDLESSLSPKPPLFLFLTHPSLKPLLLPHSQPNSPQSATPTPSGASRSPSPGRSWLYWQPLS